MDVSERKLSCLRCGEPMGFVMTENIQLGKTGWILGDLGNLIAGAMLVDVYSCKSCGRLEFFRHGEARFDEQTPQRACPDCGMEHDFDYPKCPFCSHDYYAK